MSETMQEADERWFRGIDEPDHEPTHPMKEAEMEAGRELDALVAEKVMGRAVTWVGPERWRVLCFDPPEYSDASQPGGYWVNEVPRYSRDLSAAWDVEKGMRLSGWLVSISGIMEGAPEGRYLASFRHVSPTERGIGVRSAPDATSDTAPHAICLAALAAMRQPTP